VHDFGDAYDDSDVKSFEMMDLTQESLHSSPNIVAHNSEKSTYIYLVK